MKMNTKTTLIVWFATAAITSAHASYAFTNFAGQPGGSGNANGTGIAARFNYPIGVATDASGNIYVTDTENHTIRRITLAGGVVSTIAGSAGQSGSADGTGSAARFYAPAGIAVDGSGNLYVADYGNSTIRKITPSRTSWSVKTLACTAGVTGKTDGIGSKALFSDPLGIAVDLNGNVYVADTGNQTIRKITPAGTVSTLAGHTGVIGSDNGIGIYATVGTNFVVTNVIGTNVIGTNAEFDLPMGLAVDSVGNIYIADNANNSIRRITPGGDVTTVVSGLSPAPNGVAVDSAGKIYVTAVNSPYLTVYNPDGSINGTKGSGFASGTGVAVDQFGNIFVADSDAQIIWWIPTDNQGTIALAGSSEQSGDSDGMGVNAIFAHPEGLAIDTASNVYVADTGNHMIRVITPFGLATDLAGTGGAEYKDGPGRDAIFDGPEGVAVDTFGNVYVADNGWGRIQKITPGGKITTVARALDGPDGLAVDSGGNLYVDQANDVVEMISPQGMTTTLSSFPSDTMAGVAVDGAGNVYVADNNKIYKAPPNGTATNWVTNGVTFSSPTGVAVDSSNNVFVADTGDDRIIMITQAGLATDIAGTNNPVNPGSSNAIGTNATFRSPSGLAVDGAGNLYIADRGNNSIRKIAPTNGNWTVTTIAGGGASGSSSGSSNGIGTNALFSGSGFRGSRS